jgi:hypothetical protein
MATAYAQKPSFCYAYTSNYSNKVLYISKVLDPNDFKGTTWNVLEYSIKEAFKQAVKNKVDNKLYEYALGITVNSQDQNDKLFTNSYDAGRERKKLIEKFKRDGYNVFELNVE